MSGHSHAKTIKHQKEITDRKRGQIFSKMARVLGLAVKEGGGNPETNTKLRIAIETAKKWNMPKENIERAIKRGLGEGSEENLEEVLFEAYGPGNIALIIEGITDNKNRTLGEIKQVLNQNSGKLVAEGAIRWMFERKGIIEIEKAQNPEKNDDDLEMLAIEAGADDIYRHENSFDIYTKVADLENVKKNLEAKEIKISSSAPGWIAKEEIEAEEKIKTACQKLFEALDELDSVQEIYSNLKE